MCWSTLRTACLPTDGVMGDGVVGMCEGIGMSRSGCCMGFLYRFLSLRNDLMIGMDADGSVWA